MNDEEGVVRQKVVSPAAIELGLGLRAVRKERQVGVRELASGLGIEPSLVSLAELATRPPNVEYVSRVLGFLAVSGDEYRWLVKLAHRVKEPNWVVPGAVEYPELLLEYERTASTVVLWAPQVLPDLVQTPDYARSVLDSGILTGDEMGQCQMMRLVRRDAVFFENSRATITLFLNAEVLVRRVGGVGVIREQLRELLSLMDDGRVVVRIMPTDPGGRPGLLSPFMLFGFHTRAPVVGICEDHLYAYLAEQVHVRRYRTFADRLARNALDERPSRVRIVEAITELEQDSDGSSGHEVPAPLAG
ncbi:helix-turn-helix transcriptional regulator [Amycolatopsis sp. NPDC058986]|uniref:helix-turn-helix domain-containing protein n=1 Tax=unclassified Amycolatopsis TaxID=2618356 RepID=UPI00366E1FBB